MSVKTMRMTKKVLDSIWREDIRGRLMAFSQESGIEVRGRYISNIESDLRAFGENELANEIIDSDNYDL